MRYVITVNRELYHHGILGMKWGKQNGPPYPLGASDHSASERKAGYKKSLGGGRNESLYNRNEETSKEKKKFSLTDNQKKAIKIGAAVAVTALAAYGTYRFVKSGKAKELKSLVNKGIDHADYILHKDEYAKRIGEIKKISDGINPGFKPGKEFDFQMLSNAKDKAPLSEVNCQACTFTYELKRRFGNDAVSQAALVDTRKYQHRYLMDKLYENSTTEMSRDYDLLDNLRKLKNKARGNLLIQANSPEFGGGGHSLAFENVGRQVIVIDNQRNRTFNISSTKGMKEFFDYYEPGNVMGFARTDNLKLNADSSFAKLLAIGKMFDK